MAQIKSKAPGIVKVLKVKIGDIVKAGSVAVIMEAMKMEMPLACTADGIVTDIKFEEGARVGPGVVLMEIE